MVTHSAQADRVLLGVMGGGDDSLQAYEGRLDMTAWELGTANEGRKKGTKEIENRTKGYRCLSRWKLECYDPNQKFGIICRAIVCLLHTTARIFLQPHPCACSNHLEVVAHLKQKQATPSVLCSKGPTTFQQPEGPSALLSRLPTPLLPSHTNTRPTPALLQSSTHSCVSPSFSLIFPLFLVIEASHFLIV